MQDTEHLLRRKGRAGWIGKGGILEGGRGGAIASVGQRGWQKVLQDWHPVGPQNGTPHPVQAFTQFRIK